MEWLKDLLGIQVRYEHQLPFRLPNYIQERYRIQPAVLDGLEVLFLSPADRLEPAATLKKPMARAEEKTGRRVILVLKSLTTRQKEALIRKRIPFLVEKKQVYLPFMGIYLQNRDAAAAPFRKEILPSSQLLLLSFIYQGAAPLSFSQAGQKLALTATSISRAARQLEELELIRTRKKGTAKILFSDLPARDLFEKARSCLVSPVKRTVYVSRDCLSEEMPESGYTALAAYSSLNSPRLVQYASSRIGYWKDRAENSLEDPEEQAAIELWRYDPQKLSDQKTVDALSLALALGEDEDERVQMALEEMLSQVWKKIGQNQK